MVRSGNILGRGTPNFTKSRQAGGATAPQKGEDHGKICRDEAF